MAYYYHVFLLPAWVTLPNPTFSLTTNILSSNTINMLAILLPSPIGGVTRVGHDFRMVCYTTLFYLFPCVIFTMFANKPPVESGRTTTQIGEIQDTVHNANISGTYNHISEKNI